MREQITARDALWTVLDVSEVDVIAYSERMERTSAFGQKRTLTNLILQSLMFTRRFRVDFIDEFIE